MIAAILVVLAKLAVVLLLPPLLPGLIARTKALVAGRVGPPLLQPYYDIAKLLRKQSVVSTTTTWVFLAGPAVGLAGALISAVLIPIGDARALWSFDGDFIALAYVLGLSRFFTMAAALDTGSSFEGMGAAREATFACFAEPAFILGLMALARATGSLSISAFLESTSISHMWSAAGASIVLVAAGLFVVLLAENCRLPVDDPTTHLELTMIHEVMVLDHGGPMFGTILYSAALKLFIFAALLVRIVLPIREPVWFAWFCFVAGVLAIAIIVGLVESAMARLRMPQVPALLLSACLLCALAVVLLVR